MRSGWRYRCPKGHSCIDYRGYGYLCQSCDEKYLGDAFDAAEHEFPVSDARVETKSDLDVEVVLAEAVRICDERDLNWLKTRNLRHLGDSREVSRAFRVLRDRGLVEKMDRSAKAWWRPTDKGRNVAQSAGLDRNNEGEMLQGAQP